MQFGLQTYVYVFLGLQSVSQLVWLAGCLPAWLLAHLELNRRLQRQTRRRGQDPCRVEAPFLLDYCCYRLCPTRIDRRAIDCRHERSAL